MVLTPFGNLGVYQHFAFDKLREPRVYSYPLCSLKERFFGQYKFVVGYTNRRFSDVAFLKPPNPFVNAYHICFTPISMLTAIVVPTVTTATAKKVSSVFKSFFINLNH
jgi:hypothetical protein